MSSTSSSPGSAVGPAAAQVDEFEEFKNQGRFKSFVSDFTGQLLSFEKAKEWADLIKCLQRITRVLSKYNMFPVIPEKALFCKRLAQCCNPALPPGVHQKALETYEIVFEQIGSKRLAKDLAYYSAGLLPLFQYASMQVKPKFIELIQKYYLPLGHELIPCMSGLIMSLAPGLEESNSETYPKVLKLIDALGEATSRQALFHAIWKTISLNPSTRIGACHYLLERCPREKSIETMDIFMPNRNTLVLNAIINSLSDSATLVQRAVLDILIGHFRLDEQPFQAEGLVRLVQKTLYIPLKREASLTRRVYCWLLGESGSAADSVISDPLYFDKWSKVAVVMAIENIFNLPVTTADAASLPYRILQQLFDKPEVSAPIIFDILPFVLKRLHLYKEGFLFSAEVIAQTNVLIDSLQPEVTWRFINDLILKDSASTPAGKPVLSLNEVDSLTEKMLELNSAAAQTKFLPSLLKVLFTAAETISSRGDLDEVLKSLQLSLKIVGKIHPSVTPVVSHEIRSSAERLPMSPSAQAQVDLVSEAFSQYLAFYCVLLRKLLIPLWDTEAAQVEEALRVKSQSRARLRCHEDLAAWRATTSVKTMDIASQILVAMYSHFKLPSEDPHVLLDSSPPMDATPTLIHPAATTNPKLAAILAQQQLHAGTGTGFAAGPSRKGPLEVPVWLHTVWETASATRHPLASVLAIRTFVNTITLPPNASITSDVQKKVMESKMCHRIAQRLWELLHPALSIVHYQSAGLFTELRDFAPEICEDVISTELISSSFEQRVQGLQRFALLWRLTGELSISSVGNSSAALPFTRNLFQMLDTLNDEQPMVKLAGRTWLADSISKIERILDPLFIVLLDKNVIRSGGVYQAEYDSRRVLYVFKILQWIIECDFRSFMQYVTEKLVSKEVLVLFDGVHEDNASDFRMKPKNYLELLVLVSLRFISGQVSPKANPEFISKNSVVQTTSASFLQYLMQKVTIPSTAIHLAKTMQEHVLQNLAQAVSMGNLILQAQLLGLLRTIILIDHSSHSVHTLAVSTTPAASPVPPISSTSATSSGVAPSSANSTPQSGVPSQPPLKDVQGPPSEFATDIIGRSPMFLQTITIGLLQPNTDFNIRFYWLEFITSCIPYLHKNLAIIAPPIIKCICEIINSQDGVYDSVGSKDAMMLLKALNFIISYLLAGLDQDKKNRDANSSSTSNTNVVSSFFRNIFQQGDSSDSQTQSISTPTSEAVVAMLQSLPVVFESLVKVWGPPSIGHGKMTKSLGLVVDFSSDETHNRYALQDQVLHILEPLYSNFPSRLLTSSLYMWRFHSSDSVAGEAASTNATSAAAVAKLTVLEIFNSLSNVTSDSIFKSLNDIAKHLHTEDVKRAQQAAQQSRSSGSAPAVLIPVAVGPSGAAVASVPVPGPSEPVPSSTSSALSPLIKPRSASRPSTTVHNQDPIIGDFLVYFCEWGTKPLSESGCGHLVNLARELLNSHNPHTILQLFRALDVYLSKPPKTVFRKFKRDIQEIVQKLIDVSMSIANRTFVDLSASWKPEVRFCVSQDDPNSGVGSFLSVNALGLPNLPSDDSFVLSDANQSSDTEEAEVMSIKRAICLQSLSNISTKITALLEKAFEGEKDRVTAIIAQLAHQLLFVAKPKSSQDAHSFFLADSADASLSALVSLAQCETIDIKTWRKEVLDMFLYNTGFFRAEAKQLKQWSVIINQIFKDDKLMWAELIRIVTKSLAPQNIFVSKYDENKARALSVKRLAFVIYSGGIDQYTDQLPLIQEKLVDAIKIRDYGKTISKVLLCLRVLLVRVSANALRVFWPVILSELMRIFELSTPDPELSLAAAKFLDLSLVLHQEDFNIYDWMFVSDFDIGSRSRDSAFIPFVQRVAQLDVVDAAASAPYRPQRPAPVITINKLESSSAPGSADLIDLGTGRMTWQGFSVWLSQFSSLQYGNRVASIDPRPDQAAIDGILLHDFTSSKLTKSVVSGVISETT